jgi:hypothetical protein
MTCISKDVEKWNPYTLVVEMQNGTVTVRKAAWRFLKKLKRATI